MPNKLQELTDRLYNEGLSKGKQEGEELLKKAEAEAARLIADARKEAEGIVASAKKEAEDLKKKAEGDIRTAISQSLSQTRQRLEDLIVTKAVGKAPEKLLADGEFVKGMITSIVSAFNPTGSEPVDLDLVLPEHLKEAMEPYLTETINKEFGKNVHVGYSSGFEGGFTVGPRGEGYFISFTDKEFDRLISEHLRPVARKLLFG